ncbi:hypothetical protein AAW31_16390 [Nitrosomonas communis]|uniref:Four helix bundle protein n=1 Tax=Nitrosomonas communis TaxID=44574 RepID=A0A0F7KIU7_9PROT|nr:hypothetical protein AAW31_16390 [Nitrosomonas communis]
MTEIETQIFIAQRFGYLFEEQLLSILNLQMEASKMINSFMNKLSPSPSLFHFQIKSDTKASRRQYKNNTAR